MFPHISPEAWVLIGIAGWALVFAGLLARRAVRNARESYEAYSRSIRNYRVDDPEEGQ